MIHVRLGELEHEVPLLCRRLKFTHRWIILVRVHKIFPFITTLFLYRVELNGEKLKVNFAQNVKDRLIGCAWAVQFAIKTEFTNIGTFL